MPSSSQRKNAAVSRHDSLFPETHTLAPSVQSKEKRRPLTIVLFAGLGGADEGLRQGLAREIDYAVNHWPAALSVHKVNHPETTHLIADILEVDPAEVVKGRPVDVLWCSPDCSSYSSAAGGRVVQTGLRVLPWKIPHWVNVARPRFLIGENVMHMALRWGPLVAKRKDGQIEHDKQGRMVMTNSSHPQKKNRRWKAFVRAIERLGYTFEWRELNAADYGAPTKRRRLFFVGSRSGEAFPWPAATHAPADDPRVKSGELLPWVAAGPLLDHDLKTPSIFEPRKKVKANRGNGSMIVENTMIRCAHGVMLEVLETPTPYLLRRSETGEITPTQKMGSDGQLHAAGFIQKEFSSPKNRPERRSSPLHEGLPTITTTDHNRLASAFLRVYHSGKRNTVTDQTTGQTTGQDRRGNLHDPVSTLDTSNRLGLTQVNYSPLPAGRGLSGAAAGIWYSSDAMRGGETLWEGVRTLTTHDRSGYLYCAMFTHSGNGGSEAQRIKGLARNFTSAHEPVRTLMAGWNKAGVLRTNTEAADLTLQDLEAQHPHCHKVYDLLLKHCGYKRLEKHADHERRLVFREIGGVRHILSDVGLRMLDRKELGRLTGFPDGYVVEHGHDGRKITDADAKKMIGNAVPPAFSAALGRSVRPLLDAADTDVLPDWLQARRDRNADVAQAAD